MKTLFCTLLLFSNFAFASSGLEDCGTRIMGAVGNQTAQGDRVRVSGQISLDSAAAVSFGNVTLMNGMRCDVDIQVEGDRVRLDITTPSTQVARDLNLYSISNVSQRYGYNSPDGLGTMITKPTVCHLQRNTIVLQDTVVNKSVFFDSKLFSRQAVLTVDNGAILNVQFSDGGEKVANCLLRDAQ